MPNGFECVCSRDGRRSGALHPIRGIARLSAGLGAVLLNGNERSRHRLPPLSFFVAARFSVLGSFSLVTGRQQNDPQKKCGSKRPRPVTNTFPCVTIEDTIPGPTERRASQGPALFSLSLGEQGALSPSPRITTPVVVFETTPAWSTLGFLSLVVAFLKVVRSETQLWIESCGPTGISSLARPSGVPAGPRWQHRAAPRCLRTVPSQA